MTTFRENDKIDVQDMERTEQQLFMFFCMGIVKYHLDEIPTAHEHYDKFDVHLYDGGLSGFAFDIASKDYPNGGFCIGTCEGNLGGCNYIHSNAGVTGIFSMEMDKTVFTIEELNSFLLLVVKKLLFEDKIKEVIDVDMRKKAFDEYEMKYDENGYLITPEG